jgi:hypothetical protein
MLQEREERLRDTAESNNFRTMFFTLCKIALCIGVFGYTQVPPPVFHRLFSSIPTFRWQFKAVAAALKKRQS